MYPVSNEFMEQMKSPERQTFGKVVIDYTDPFIDQSINVTVNEQANVSYPAQVADGVEAVPYKYASLDGSWVLGEGYCLAPAPDEIENFQMGWWGAQLAGISGVFTSPYPALTLNFLSRPIHSLKVVGDSARCEYPVDFVVKLYNAAGILLYSETVAGNTLVSWTKQLESSVSSVVKMTLEISKWSHPGRQVKITEFFTSVQQIYEGKDIISISLLEEMESSIGPLPIGNISSNEINVKLSNLNRWFDAGNTESPLYNLLKPNRRIRAWVGIEKEDEEMEMVPMGTFWSGDWDAPEDGVIAQTTGRDRMEFLDQGEFAAGPFTDITLYDLAAEVFTDAGLTYGEYWIDSELMNYTVPYVKPDSQTHREWIRRIVEACLGRGYCDRENVIRIEGSKQVEELNLVTVNEQANISYPEQVTDGVEVPSAKYASLDGSWVLGEGYSLAPALDETESFEMGWWGSALSGIDGMFTTPYPLLTVSFFERAIEAVKVVGDTLRGEYPVDFTIRVYDATNMLLSTQDITGNDQVSNVIQIPENPTRATKMTLEISKWSHPGRQVKIVEFLNTAYPLEITPADYFRKNNPAKYGELVNCVDVEYQPVNPDGSDGEKGKVSVRDEISISENSVLKFSFPTNPLIQTEEMAQDIAEKILAEYGQDPRRNLELEWRGNPALNLGNTMTVADTNEQNNYKIIRQEIDYDGTLRAQLNGRKVI